MSLATVNSAAKDIGLKYGFLSSGIAGSDNNSGFSFWT